MPADDTTDWTKFGLLKSPFEELGFSEKLYEDQRKKDLVTNTKDYLNKRNEFLAKAKDLVDNAWTTSMDMMKNVPHLEKTKLSNKIATNYFNTYQDVAKELFPGGDTALKNAGNINLAEEIRDGNIGVSTTTGKRGRPRKTVDEKKDKKDKKDKKKKDEKDKKKKGKK